MCMPQAGHCTATAAYLGSSTPTASAITQNTSPQAAILSVRTCAREKIVHGVAIAARLSSHGLITDVARRRSARNCG